MVRLNAAGRARFRHRKLLTSVGVGALFLVATPAWGQDVASQSDWNTAVAAVAAAGAGSTVTINFTSGFTLTGSLAALQANNPNVTILITGNNQTIDGASIYQGIQVSGANAPTVNISSLGVVNTKAVGGAGEAGQNGYLNSSLSYGSGGGGGGGLGAGGGLFVGSGANVTLSAVTFSGNNATGGTAGNGGVAQNVASSPTGGNGGAGGTLNGGAGTIGGGGAGGLGGNTGTQGTAGTAGSLGAGGGGGGGSGTTNSTAYTPNNNGGAGSGGGGNGGQDGDGVTNNNGSQGPGSDGGSGGSGGAGRGGAIYVATGATLSILDTGIAGATVAGGGAGSQGVGQGPSSFNGSPGAPGQGQGQALYIGAATATVGVSSGTLTYANSIAGTGGVIKTGAGTLTLTGANTYAGGTSLNGGTLNVGSIGAIGTSGSISFGGGTLQYSAANQTDYSTRFSTAAGQAYSIDTNGQNVNFATALTSSGGTLTKLGSGTLTLTGANTYSGGTTIGGGTLVQGSAGALGTGSVTLGGGTLDLGAFDLRISRLGGGTGTITSSGGGNLTLLAGETGTFGSAGNSITTSLGLNVGATSTLILHGNNVLTGGITLAGRLEIADSGAAGGSANTITTIGSVINYANSVDSAATVLIASNTTQLEVLGSDSATQSGQINEDAAGRGFEKIGTGTLTLSGTNSYTGLTTVSGGTLSLSGGAAIADTGAVQIGGGATLNLASSETIGSLSGLSGSFVTLGTNTLTAGGTNASTSFLGSMSGTGGFTKAGTGTLILGGVNSYTGLTTISGGTLQLGTANAVNGSSGVQISAGATFDLAGFADSVGSLAGAGNVTLGSGGQLQFGADNSATAFSGTISGDGTARKGGSGTFTLSGAVNLTASGTSLFVVDAGTVAVTGSGSINADVVQSFGTLTNGGTISTTALQNFAILTNNGLITGATQNFSTFDNEGTMGGLSNNGGTAVNGGTINGAVNNFTSFTSTGTVNGDLGNFGTALLQGQLNGNLANQSAGVTITLTGTLTGVTRYQGSAGSTLDLASFNTTIGALAGDGVVSLGSATITVGAAAGTESFNGVISGGGALTKTGASTQILNGVNTYTGLTTISGGTLQIGFGGSLAGNVSNAANFSNSGTVGGVLLNSGNADNDGTIAGGVDNDGTFTSTGTIGVGAINEAGAVMSASGQINGFVNNKGAFNVAGALTGITDFSQVASGQLNLNSFDLAVGSLSGAGGINIGGGTLTVGAGNSITTFSGAIAGFGNLTKVGTGTLILAGASSFGGLTTISAGTLQLNATGSIGGDVRNDAVFNVAGTVSGLVANNGTLNAMGILNGGLTNSGAANLSNQVNGAVANNAGTITLIGTTTGIRAFSQAAGATFNLAGFDTIVGSIAGDGSIQLGGATLTAGGDNRATSFAGIVSGSGGLTKAGTGTLQLSGANLYTGLTTISGGTLQINATGSVAGNVTSATNFSNAGTVAGALLNNGNADNSGTIAGGVDNSSTFTSTGTIGVGAINEAGASMSVRGQLNGFVMNSGTFNVTGALTGITDFSQTATGQLSVGAFNVAFGSLSGAGGVSLASGAALTVGSGNSNTVFSGTISGQGALTKAGIGTLALTGANTYSGGTTIANGTILVGNGGTTGSLAGNVVLQNSNSSLAFNRTDTNSFSGNVSGAGSLAQGGSGTLVLTGANTYSGGTFVFAGRLRGDSTSLRGDIQDNATLEFAQAAAGTFAGRMFGAGLVEKTGGSQLLFTGDNSNFTGETHVLGGALTVNSLLSRSRVTVSNGASLSGTGTVGGLIAQSGSIVAPGNGGIGTLGVNGNIQLLGGSTLSVQVQAAGSSLLLGNGTAQLAGTLAITNGGGAYGMNTTFVLVQADGGRTGTFDTVTGLDTFGTMFRAKIVYTGTQVELLLAPSSLIALLNGASATPNQLSTLRRIDAAVAAGFDATPLLALYSLTPASVLAAAGDSLSGEVYPTATRVALDDERLVRDAAIGRVRAAQDAGFDEGFGAWGEVIGSWGHGHGDGNAAAFDRDNTGFVAGLDAGGTVPGGGWRFGLLAHHVSTSVHIAARVSDADIRRTGGGAYAGIEFGGFRGRAGLTYSHLSLDATRSIAFAAFTQSVAGKTDGNALQGFGEAAYHFQTGARTSVEPFVQFSIAQVQFDAFSETGGAARLRVSRQARDLTTATLGLRGETSMPIGAQTNLRLTGSIGGRRASGDRTVATLIALDAAPNQDLAISAAPLDRFSLVGSLDASLDLGRAVSLTVGYSGAQASNASDHGVRGTVALRF